MGDYRREIDYFHRMWTKDLPPCPGYGERKGKCDSWPIRGGEYCPDCTIAMLSDYQQVRKGNPNGQTQMG